MNIIYYAYPHNEDANRALANYLGQRAVDSEAPQKMCVDHHPRNLWQITQQDVLFLVSGSQGNFTFFKSDENNDQPLYLSAEDFMAIAREPRFAEENARVNLVRQACVNNSWNNLLSELKGYGEMMKRMLRGKGHRVVNKKPQKKKSVHSKRVLSRKKK